MRIEVKEDSNPSLARIIIAGKWTGDVNTTKQLLQEVCDKWPKGKKVDCLITCGAFLNFDWPQSLTDVGDNKYPNETALNLLISEAKRQCDLLIDEELRKRLLACTEYITIGIDSYKDKISLSDVSIKELHVELVALIDLKTKQYFWTGKSYPTTGQENGLVRFQDLSTHFLELPFGKVMILGCHDLKMFDPRVYKRANIRHWRQEILDEFHKVAKNEKPTLLLHHPHETDCVEGIKITNGKYSPGTWDRAWGDVKKIIPTVEKYAGAGRYYNSENPYYERSKLNDVLGKTKLGDTIDFVVNIWK